MTDIAKKIANANYDEIAGATSRTWSKRGVSRLGRRCKRLRNKAARRIAARIAFEDQAA